MAKILRLNRSAPAKLDFQRAPKRRRKKDPEQHGQFNLFSPSLDSGARIMSMPSRLAPFEEALMMDERGDELAQEKYWQAIAAGDCVADAYCNLGILESKAGQSDRAFDCFTRSLREAPRHLESHYNLANLYFEVGDLRLAKEHYQMAAQINAAFPNIYFNLGLVLALDEDYNGAIAALTTYTQLAPEEAASNAEELVENIRASVSALSQGNSQKITTDFTD